MPVRLYRVYVSLLQEVRPLQSFRAPDDGVPFCTVFGPQNDPISVNNAGIWASIWDRLRLD